VIELALPWLASLAPPHVSLSVNVSALCIGDPAFAGTLREKCREHEVEPERIILELTETASLQDANVSLRNLTRMRVAGFRLSLDDFGTGYSSLSQLARLPFSEIKIDRSFVSTATMSEESRLMVASVIDLGRSLGLVTVAEGVEDGETLDLLHSLGCDLAQGYFMSRPLSPAAAAVWGGMPPSSARVTPPD
jgi:EAL domain-containing protein (putative c-di-GMP-specific phosphodiesterase class I)